eukprot:1637041-Pyramimonas_sp.AAC.1
MFHLFTFSSVLCFICCAFGSSSDTSITLRWAHIIRARARILSHTRIAGRSQVARAEREYPRSGDQSSEGRANIPAAGTNQARGEGISPQRGPIERGEREYT